MSAPSDIFKYHRDCKPIGIESHHNIANVCNRSIPPTPNASYDRPNRLKIRDDGSIRWTELLDKFKGIQDKAKRSKGLPSQNNDRSPNPSDGLELPREKTFSQLSKSPQLPNSAENVPARPNQPSHKAKSSLSNFSRLARGVSQKKK